MHKLTFAIGICFGAYFNGQAVAGTIPCESHTDEQMKRACRLEVQAIERTKRLGDGAWDEWMNLEGDAKSELKKAFRAISWDDESLKRIPAVTYVSAAGIESGKEYHQFLTPEPGSGALQGTVQLFEGPRFDIWFARHRFLQNPASLVGVGFVVVDKTKTPRKAYFLSAVPEPMAKGALPPLIPFKENCYFCHANGPRFIRAAAPTDSMARIQTFNEKMLAYGKVDTVLATKHFLPRLPDHAFEPVQHRACIDCHSDKSPFRNPLRRMHINEIDFMLTHEKAAAGHVIPAGASTAQALMPMERQAFSADELACLRAWLNRTPRPGCNARGEVEESGSRRVSYLLEAPYAKLRGEARSTLSTIPIDGFRLSGSLDCEGDSCRGEIQADLRSLTTGIALRDRHLKENYLKVSAHPFATASLESVSLSAPSQVQASITLKGATQSYGATLRCSRSDRIVCELSGLKLALDRHGITPPSFLGVKVDPEVTVSGTLVFRQPVRSLATETLGQASP